MPNLMNDFEHLKSMETTALLQRREDIKARHSELSELPDDALIEMLAIARILRTRTVSPKVTGGKKTPASLDAL